MKKASRIVPCPIKEAIMEVRFDPIVNESAVFGLVYGHIQDEFSNITNLPILEIPPSIRKRDPKLMYLPHYRMESISNSNKLIQIGPKSFSVINNGKYPGWDEFIKDIQYGLSKLRDSKVVRNISRFSIRYLNFFDSNILPKTNLEVALSGNQLKAMHTSMRFEISREPMIMVLSISNQVQMKTDSGKLQKGSTIDIDTIYNAPPADFFARSEELMNKSHDLEKELFFDLMSEDFAKSLIEVVYA